MTRRCRGGKGGGGIHALGTVGVWESFASAWNVDGQHGGKVRFRNSTRKIPVLPMARTQDPFAWTTGQVLSSLVALLPNW